MGAVLGANCGMRMASLGDVSIGCVGCNSRYRPTYVCLGLTDSVIDAIKEYGGRGVLFLCTFLGWRGKVVLMGHNLAVLLMVV